MIKISFIFFIIFILVSFKGHTKENLLELIKSNKDFTIFYELIKAANYEELFNQKTQFKKVVYIPNNEAFHKLPDKISAKMMDKDIAKKIIKTHLYSGEVKEVFKDPKKKVVIIERVEINGDLVKIFSNADLFVKDIVNQETNLITNHYTIIPVKCVMFLQLSAEDNRLSTTEQDNSLVTSCCLLTDNEVVTFFSDQYL